MVLIRQITLVATLLGAATLPAARLDSPAAFLTLEVQVDHLDDWRPILEPVGLKPVASPSRFRIVVGDSPAARQEGFLPSDDTVRAAWFTDSREPALEIFWDKPQQIHRFEMPLDAIVFQREKQSGTPVLAGVRREGGAVLWASLPPGERGYERYPYLIQALLDIGVELPFRTNRLWAFFDYSYRMRVDPVYFAERWRRAGIAALHVSAWHFFEPDDERDGYLRRLIEACHRQGILIYAWLELPHVSQDFWRDRPECREKTADLQDAELDWRKLVNLADPACFEPVSKGTAALLRRFDWDGVNFAELYFESLHGPANSARFTPLNDWVRRDAKNQLGFDPLELFDGGSARHWETNTDSWRRFADYRAELALDLQRRWFELIREQAPELDLVVTQIDDRLDPRMRDYLGADAAALLPLADQYNFRLIIEDPATLWDEGPERYTKIADRYRPLAQRPEQLGIDLNIVERYQQTYPTRRQTGGELIQLIHAASSAFDRVLLYFEHSLGAADLPILPRVSPGARVEFHEDHATVDSPSPVGLAWRGAANVNGKPWPIRDAETLWLPAGSHRIEPASGSTQLCILSLNADLIAAQTTSDGVAANYRSDSRVAVMLSHQPSKILIDGAIFQTETLINVAEQALFLPAGRHEVHFQFSGLIR